MTFEPTPCQPRPQATPRFYLKSGSGLALHHASVLVWMHTLNAPKYIVYSYAKFYLLFPPLPLSSRLQEKHTREKLRDHLKMITRLQSELAEMQGRVAEVRTKIREADERRKRMLATATR